MLPFVLACEEETPQFFHNGLAPVVTGWEDQPQMLNSQYCRDCHSKSHEEWSLGMHAKAWTDPSFQEGLKVEPKEWCVNCHAPLQHQMAEYRSGEAKLLAEGINCAGCHVRSGRIYGTHQSDRSPHEIVVTAYLNKSEFCAECHQFNFPFFKGEEVHYSKDPMQNTHSEWERSGYERPCQTCHYAGHRLLGPHVPKWLQDHFFGFKVDIPHPGLLSFRFQIDNGRAHNLPTGDLFKSLAFEISDTPEFKRIVFSKKWARFYGLGRFSDTTFWNRTLVHDSSIPSNKTSLNVTADVPTSGALFARLIYRNHDPILGGRKSVSSEPDTTVIWQERVR